MNNETTTLTLSEVEGLVPDLRFPEFVEDDGWEYMNGNDLFDSISNKKHNSDLPILAITQEHGAIPRDLIDYHVTVTEKSVESYKVVEAGDFIISLRSFQGGIEFSNYLGLCSPAYIILRRKGDMINDFYRHYFKSIPFIEDLNKNLEGIRDGKMVSYKQFSEILIPKPGKSEQQKIASCLSSLDEVIAAHSQKLEALKAHKKGLMQNLFPNPSTGSGGETVPAYRFPEFREDGEWVVSTLGKIATIASGGTPSRAKGEYWNGKIPWVSTTLIDFNRIESSNEFITEKGLKNSSTKILPKNTILMAMYGQGKTRGKVAILGIDATINQACASITLKDMMNTEFVFQNLASRYEEIRLISNPGGQQNLSGDLVKKIPFLYPSANTGEQKKIASCLSSLDEVISAQSEKIEQLKLHKKALMQGLFPKRCLNCDGYD
jgi:type I restriction enzyme, S subunit